MEHQQTAAEIQRHQRIGTTARPSRPADITGLRHIQRMAGNQKIGMIGPGSEGGDRLERVERRLDARRGGGMPLSGLTRRAMESRIGADFGGVRVHADAEAAEMSSALGARAFTLGGDIYFGAGQYRPDTRGGGRLLAHELAHTVQQGAAPPSGRPSLLSAGSGEGRMIQRQGEDELDRAHDSERLEFGEPQDRITPANPTASAPPAPLAPPSGGSFAPLRGRALTDRRAHGMSTDSGPMIGEIETALFPTGGSNPPCTPMPANFEATVAAALSTELTAAIPTLAPVAAPDPMAIATASAEVAMPIIHSHYSPHAPSVAPASFMARVSRKAVNFADPIRNNDADLGEFLEWYAGARAPLRTLTSNKCGMDTAWWTRFSGWLRGAGASWNAAPHSIRERAALYDTYKTTVTHGGRIEFGLGFDLGFIPHTVTHEAMHLFQHADLRTQVGLLPSFRSSTDIFTEGFAEYLARGVRNDVVNGLQARVPPVLTPAQEATARTSSSYPHYFAKAVEIRDILYRHGQDGEEAIRRAFFRGEGWRFGLLETAAGAGSPIETDRAVPAQVDILFSSGTTPVSIAALRPIAAYLATRSVATVEIIGRADPTGVPADNLTLGQNRADTIRTWLIAHGVPAARITATSRGDADQIPGGNSANRRATVRVIDARNESPGLPGPGRP